MSILIHCVVFGLLTIWNALSIGLLLYIEGRPWRTAPVAMIAFTAASLFLSVGMLLFPFTDTLLPAYPLLRDGEFAFALSFVAIAGAFTSAATARLVRSNEPSPRSTEHVPMLATPTGALLAPLVLLSVGALGTELDWYPRQSIIVGVVAGNAASSLQAMIMFWVFQD